MLFEPDLSTPYLREAARLRDAFAVDAVAHDQAGGRPLDQLRLLKDSGLLRLTLPRAFGGEGQPWSTALRVGREFAKADGSLGHLFGYHCSSQHAAHVRGSPRQAEALYRASAEGNWFWANNANSAARSLLGKWQGDHWLLNGSKPFTSGSHIADRVHITWIDEDSGRTLDATIPADRAGWRALDDWDAFGQRQTGSGACRYENVRVEAEEVFERTGPADAAYRTLTPFIQQSVLLNVFLGTAQGALLAARDYTVNESRPWVHSGVERHVDDPWVKRVYGDLYTRTLAATALADQALEVLDRVWEKGDALTAAERGEASITLAAANAFAGNTALDVTSKIFEVTGARSTARGLGLDRFWRNVRTHTLHNPEEYKTRNVGYWFLTGEPPVPSGIQ
ncbi:monooxygenase [Xylophilus rhododendri]|uniref:Monooxygenase n=1 Tax=Xylophilus rhododendri TaxID=2697032 RepID=A0A857JB39_9BURK|nr:acyl-CoA dehydrogenase family protein [Xylophilus rhododendri]QHJ00908.1 monooxygenase [Xylophilus rhododendri]